MCCAFSTLHAQYKPVTLQLKWLHQFEFAGYYAADIKGYYAEKGLKVTIKPGDKNHSPITEVLRGRATFGISDCDVLINYTKGDPIVAMASLFQHSPYIVLATPYQNIHSPSDLIGKRILSSDNYGWAQMKAMLMREGIPLDSVRKLEHTWKPMDLLNGNADAMTGYVTVEPYQFLKMGIDLSYIDPINYGVDFYGDILFTQQSVINNDPGLTEAFRKASIKGWEYATENPEEIIEYILTLPGVERRGATKESLMYEARQMRKLMIPDLVEIGHMNEGRWQHILDIYTKLGMVGKTTRIDDFLYNPEGTQIDRIIEKIIYISITILLIVAAIVLYSISLKRAVQNRTSQLEFEMAQGNETREKLMISEERLDLATEAAGIGIWDWNLQENTIYLSEMWKTMLGYEPNELPDNMDTFFLLIHPDDKDEILKNERLHIDGDLQKLQFICRMKTKAGPYKWILSISRAGFRNEAGKATRIIGIHLDVDDIKNKEVELNQLSQELLVSNKELKQFAYITSHNLRSPVANLLMLMRLFRTDELSEKNRSLFEKTDLSIHQLNQTLEDLNEILSARFKSDKSEDIAFETVLIEVIHSISEEIENTGAKITYDFDSASMIFYSKKALHSIFLNLLTNAIKYAKPGTNPTIFISTNMNKEHIFLQARDEGIGIDLEKHGKKIFGLYQRFHNVSSGKGLGLYIIKNQVEAQNGSISVDSQAEQGATFTINFAKTNLIEDESTVKNFIGR